jgi:thioredoxin-like negative regulator of GroEL
MTDRPTLVHFVASWAEAICGPHRVEVADAARVLGASVLECDVDLNQDLARDHRVMQVPSVAVLGDTSVNPIPGAQSAEDLVRLLRGAVGDCRG